MKIVVISESLTSLPKAVALLEASGHEINYVDGLIPIQEIARDGLVSLADADAIVMGRVMGVDDAALSLAPKARVIALHTSGTDNIDLDAAARRGISVTNVKGVNAAQCAEFSIGLMLAVTRQIRAGDIAIRAGKWAAETDSSLDVFGATLGLVGLGQIGREAARRARAFGMNLICHTRTEDSDFAKEVGLEYVDLDTLLARADIVSLYASLTPQTRGMIGARELARMKPSAYLVNIARGELIDEAALVSALSQGAIAGAALDVFETEPLHESPLFALGNTILTPHMAGLTRNAKSDAAVLAVHNALAVLSGDTPPNLVNRPNANLEEVAQ